MARGSNLDWLRLCRIDGIGPITVRRLLERYGSVAAILDVLPELSQRGGRAKPLKPLDPAAAERELAWHDRHGIRLLTLDDPDYPPLLAAIEDAPPLLSVRGALALAQRPTVGIVGARNASLNGRRFAEALAAELGRRQVTIVSGLARGIDGAAHHGALAHGTIAAIAGGIDIAYPREHAQLQEDVAAQGLLIAESPPGIQPQAHHFPRRNRIISGLSLGVLVVEAAIGSGSLITARLAGEQGREVMAVPGSPVDPRSRGANQLIKDGAHLIEDAEDVMAVVRSVTARTGYQLAEPGRDLLAGGLPMTDSGGDQLDAARRALPDLLDPHPVAVDEVLRRCHFSPAVVATVLLELELAGRLERHPGNRVSRLG